MSLDDEKKEESRVTFDISSSSDDSNISIIDIATTINTTNNTLADYNKKDNNNNNNNNNKKNLEKNSIENETKNIYKHHCKYSLDSMQSNEFNDRRLQCALNMVYRGFIKLEHTSHNNEFMSNFEDFWGDFDYYNTGSNDDEYNIDINKYNEWKDSFADENGKILDISIKHNINNIKKSTNYDELSKDNRTILFFVSKSIE